VHGEQDSAVSQPLCPDCYDYPGHVLWHTLAGYLWNRFCVTLRRHLASATGITQTRLRDHLVVSFAKVAEYQRRGAVHFHAVIRLDGPDGPSSPPPTWATLDLLGEVVRSAASAVEVPAPRRTVVVDVDVNGLDAKPQTLSRLPADALLAVDAGLIVVIRLGDAAVDRAAFTLIGPVGKQVVRFTAPCTLGAATSNTLAMQLITDGPIAGPVRCFGGSSNLMGSQ
jgi:hypothetical protein